ncbi:MAG: type IV pilus twitching motility protein PilT [Candidatus Omnitrophota bacterium]
MDIRFLFKNIIAKGGSDLHLCSGLPPMMRLNGVLVPIEETPLALTHEMIIEMLQAVLPEGKRKLSIGEELDLAFEIRGIARFRTNIYYDRKGICAACRVIPSVIKSIKELGLPEVVHKVVDMKRGLVLVTGVTGSGKSTTLAAIIDAVNCKRQDHIITIEDPIEFVHEHKKAIVNQKEVGLHTHSFQSALRAALREDPDVILVGEMRDLETISMAITAAETGHLVLGTLHTRGAGQSVDRMIDVFPAHQQEQIRIQLADALEMIISQVLVPSLDGKNRYMACEILVANTAVRQLVRNKKTHQLITELETGAQWGMQTLDRSLKSLVDKGLVSELTASAWIADKKPRRED